MYVSVLVLVTSRMSELLLTVGVMTMVRLGGGTGLVLRLSNNPNLLSVDNSLIITKGLSGGGW